VTGGQFRVIRPPQPDGQPVDLSASRVNGGLHVSCHAERGYFVTSLRGALDASIAPALREYLLPIVHECAGRLVIDLSAVSYADVSGLTVLVGTDRRAQLLGGLVRLAGPAAQVTSALTTTGLDRHLHVYATVEAAITGAAEV
jgi:anti-sigma B factor antagonist